MHYRLLTLFRHEPNLYYRMSLHHTPESVLSLVSSLQPLLSQPQPLSPVTQAQLASLCVGLKQVNWQCHWHWH